MATSCQATPAGRGSDDVGGDHRHVGAARAGGLGQRQSHAPGGAVADEAHAVDRLAGAAGGDEHAQPRHAPPGAASGARGPAVAIGATRRGRRAAPRRAPAAARGRADARPPPRPCEARRPASGSITCTPRARSVSRLARTAGCSYMWLFIAGATTSGQVAASAALAQQVVGEAVRRAWRSCSRRRGRSGRDRRCARARGGRSARAREAAGRGTRRARGRARTRRRAPARRSAPRTRRAPRSGRMAGVCTTRTAWPAPVARRTNSSAL